jgi:hypothetical protein
VADYQTGWNLAGLAPMAREQLLVSLRLLDWRFDLGNGMCHSVRTSVVGDDVLEREPLFRLTSAVASPRASEMTVF